MYFIWSIFMPMHYVLFILVLFLSKYLERYEKVFLVKFSFVFPAVEIAFALLQTITRKFSTPYFSKMLRGAAI